jgi:hypothetical protein
VSYAYSSDKCDAKCPTNCDFTVTQKIKNGKSECKNCVCMTDPCKVKNILILVTNYELKNWTE